MNIFISRVDGKKPFPYYAEVTALENTSQLQEWLDRVRPGEKLEMFLPHPAGDTSDCLSALARNTSFGAFFKIILSGVLEAGAWIQQCRLSAER